MIPYNELPERHEDLARLTVEFPLLNPEETARHEQFLPELVEYLVDEGEDVIAEDLTFLRSARVEEKKYWIWELYDEVGRRYYATVAEAPGPKQCLGYGDADGLSPEQFLVGEYHGCY